MRESKDKGNKMNKILKDRQFLKSLLKLFEKTTLRRSLVVIHSFLAVNISTFKLIQSKASKLRPYSKIYLDEII